MWRETDSRPQDAVVGRGADRAESAFFSAPGESQSGGGGAPLGNTAKSVDQISADRAARERRAVAFRLQRTAAAIPCRKSALGFAGGPSCRGRPGWTCILRNMTGGGPCVICWPPDLRQRVACPCCGRRISETRRGELNALLGWARERGLIPIMVTLTARHGIRDRLADQLEAMKVAKRRLRQRREWRSLKGRIAGTVTATEVTHGQNGWHTHFHEILLMDAPDEGEALAMLEGMGRSGGPASSASACRAVVSHGRRRVRRLRAATSANGALARK